jgi:hypothetical protein
MSCICNCNLLCRVDACTDFDPDCIIGVCLYRILNTGEYQFIGSNITNQDCLISGYPICPSDGVPFGNYGIFYFYWVFIFKLSRSGIPVPPDAYIVMLRPDYYVVKPDTLNSPGYHRWFMLYDIIACCYDKLVVEPINACRARCVKDGSVYYMETSSWQFGRTNPCSGDCCYCGAEIKICGPLTHSQWTPATHSWYWESCKLAFPLRRRCVGHFCQYICDREGSSVYKFRLVKPCPEGCMCKPYIFFRPYNGEPYDAECCPATYGLTISIACIDDDDPLIDFHCPAHIETCQATALDDIPIDDKAFLRRIAVRNSCLLARFGPDVNWAPGLYSSDYTDISYYGACMCSILASGVGTNRLVTAQGGYVIVTIACGILEYDARIPRDGVPCYLCDIPLGTTIESLCASNFENLVRVYV